MLRLPQISGELKYMRVSCLILFKVEKQNTLFPFWSQLKVFKTYYFLLYVGSRGSNNYENIPAGERARTGLRSFDFSSLLAVMLSAHSSVEEEALKSHQS